MRLKIIKEGDKVLDLKLSHRSWVPDELTVLLLEEILCEKIGFFKYHSPLGFYMMFCYEKEWPMKQNFHLLANANSWAYG